MSNYQYYFFFSIASIVDLRKQCNISLDNIFSRTRKQIKPQIIEYSIVKISFPLFLRHWGNILENKSNIFPQIFYGDYGEEKILVMNWNLFTFKGFIQQFKPPSLTLPYKVKTLKMWLEKNSSIENFDFRLVLILG